MRVRDLGGLLLGLLACGDVEAPPAATVEITYARLTDEGRSIDGLVVARVRAGAEGTTTTFWAGGMRVGRSLCTTFLGWELALDDDLAPITLAPYETREVRLRVRSGNRTACAPLEPLARCGELVSVVLVPSVDGAKGGAIETRFACALRARRPPT